MERSRIILDSNVFIAFYFEKDSLHKEAVLLIEQIGEKEILLPYCVLQEVTTILAYRSGKKVADQFLEDAQRADNVLIIPDQPQPEIEFYKKFKEKISFTDIALIYLSLQYNALLITFDKQLLRLYKE